MGLRMGLSQLQARTYTGDIRPYIRLDVEATWGRGLRTGGCIEWDRLPDKCQPQGDVRLVAVTSLEAGQEPATHYCPGMPEHLRQLHRQITTMATAYWVAFKEVFRNAQGAGDAQSVSVGDHLPGGGSQ
ncbi:hypothetical protein ACFLYD_06460 [Chloroflexota bacterium]